MNPPPEPPRRMVVPTTSRREMLVALLCGLGVLGFLTYAVLTMGSSQQKASSNTLTGKVVGRKFTPLKEEQLSFGRGGLKGKQLSGEYIFKVEVKSEGRVFEVPVDANTYEAVRDGGSFTFMRPRSEQSK